MWVLCKIRSWVLCVGLDLGLGDVGFWKRYGLGVKSVRMFGLPNQFLL